MMTPKELFSEIEKNFTPAIAEATKCRFSGSIEFLEANDERYQFLRKKLVVFKEVDGVTVGASDGLGFFGILDESVGVSATFVGVMPSIPKKW